MKKQITGFQHNFSFKTCLGLAVTCNEFLARKFSQNTRSHGKSNNRIQNTSSLKKALVELAFLTFPNIENKSKHVNKSFPRPSFTCLCLYESIYESINMTSPVCFHNFLKV